MLTGWKSRMDISTVDLPVSIVKMQSCLGWGFQHAYSYHLMRSRCCLESRLWTLFHNSVVFKRIEWPIFWKYSPLLRYFLQPHLGVDKIAAILSLTEASCLHPLCTQLTIVGFSLNVRLYRNSSSMHRSWIFSKSRRLCENLKQRVALLFYVEKSPRQSFLLRVATPLAKSWSGTTPPWLSADALSWVELISFEFEL